MPYASSHEDTIAAIATPLGQAGIGIVRISGSRSREIATKIFRSKKGLNDLKSRKRRIMKTGFNSPGRPLKKSWN